MENLTKFVPFFAGMRTRVIIFITFILCLACAGQRNSATSECLDSNVNMYDSCYFSLVSSVGNHSELAAIICGTFSSNVNLLESDKHKANKSAAHAHGDSSCNLDSSARIACKHSRAICDMGQHRHLILLEKIII